MYRSFSNIHVFVSHSCMVSKRPGDGVRTPNTGVTDSTKLQYVLEMKPGYSGRIFSILNY